MRIIASRYTYIIVIYIDIDKYIRRDVHKRSYLIMSLAHPFSDFMSHYDSISSLLPLFSASLLLFGASLLPVIIAVPI